MKKLGIKSAVALIALFIIILFVFDYDKHNQKNESHRTDVSSEPLSEEDSDTQVSLETRDEYNEFGSEATDTDQESVAMDSEKLQVNDSEDSAISSGSLDSESEHIDSLTAPQKKKIWVVDKPAWTEKIVKYYTEYTGKYICESEFGNRMFDRHEEAHDYYVLCGVNGYSCIYYWDDKAVAEQVPYTEEIVHPEEGHWEYQ